MPLEACKPLLSSRELSFSYGAERVLDGVSFDLNSGKVCGLLGPNGSGKSTLLRCCLGFLKPQSGSVFLEGEKITRFLGHALAKKVAYIPQQQSSPFPFTVREWVSMGRTPHMGYRPYLNAEDRQLIEEAIDCLGISALAERPLNQLSGGQRQLAYIARALAQKTALLLMDEPTAALDFQNQIRVWQTLRHVATQGVSVLICCHDPNHILWFCDAVLLMREGRVLAQGAPNTLSEKGVLQQLYDDSCSVGEINGVSVAFPTTSVGFRK